MNGDVFDHATLMRIWDRVQDGCYSAAAVRRCGECGQPIFQLTEDEIKVYLDTLVDMGYAEWRKQGGRKEGQKGDIPDICVPRDLPYGNLDFSPASDPDYMSKAAPALGDVEA